MLLVQLPMTATGVLTGGVVVVVIWTIGLGAWRAHTAVAARGECFGVVDWCASLVGWQVGWLVCWLAVTGKELLAASVRGA